MIDILDIQITHSPSSRISEIDFDHIEFARIYSDHMFVSNYYDGEWQDNQIVPYDYFNISPANTAIHYGQSIFEGLKAYKAGDGRTLIFRPIDNSKRLNKSGERMCIPSVPEELFMGALTELITLDKQWIPDRPDTSLYIRPFIFSVDEYIGIRPSSFFKFMIITCPVGPYYSTPVKVMIETHYTRAASGGAGYAKAAGNYGASLYPAKLAQDKGYHQLIWTDAKEHKYIEESGTMNIMFVIGDTLITPAVSDTILDGITRDSVITIAKDWGMKVEERKVEVEEVISAAKDGTLKDAFGAGTAATIAHIELIGYDGKDYMLPPVEIREFSNKVLKELNNIKCGKIEDRFNWIYTI